MRLSVLLILLATSLAACTADIRPDGYDAVRPSAVDAQRAQRLVNGAHAASGGPAWLAHRTTTIEMRDTWQGFLGWIGNPWPESVVHVRMDVAVGGSNARSEFLDGDDKGLVWGAQASQAYEARSGETAHAVDNDDAVFILSALHYLFELPVRAGEIPLLAALPDATVGGRTFHRVIGSWETLGTHSEHDQYVLYIDVESGRIAKAAFTVRAIAGFAKGAVHYDDMREIDGKWVAHRMSITESIDDDPRDEWLHVVEVQSVRFDAVERTALAPLKVPGS